MIEPTRAQIELVRTLLATEGAHRSDQALAKALVAVHDTFRTQLAPLVGDAGFKMLLLRSAGLARAAHPALDVGTTAGPQQSTNVRDLLKASSPPISIDAGTALFATFLALLTTFIGERLTIQALRRGWPTIDTTVPVETKT